MKRIYKALIVLAFPSVLLLFSYTGGSPGGKSGSPGDGGSTCTDCHNGTAQSQTGWISTNIPAEGFTAGETYTITATGTHTGVQKFGLELTAEDAFGSKVGMFTISEPSRTKLINANHAVTHTSGGTSVSGNSSSWSMDWTAPASSPSAVKFYAAFNAANGNGSSSGDVIYTSVSTYSLYVAPNPQITGVEPNNEQQGFIGELNITGSETEWTSGVAEVRFVYHDDNTVLFNATQITVVSDDMLTVEVSIPEDIEIGMYDVYVDDLSLDNGFVVDIYDDIFDNYLESTVKVYPNPATNNVIVEAPTNSQIRIIDISGRNMGDYKTENASTLYVNTESFSSGLYFVQVSNGQHSYTKKLTIR